MKKYTYIFLLFFVMTPYCCRPLAQRHAPPAHVKAALDLIFTCNCSPIPKRKRLDGCQGQCKFFCFVKWCCLAPYKHTITSMNKKVKEFFDRVKVIKVETNTYLDKVMIVCTFAKSEGILSNYILKIRIASNNPSRVVTPNCCVVEGIQRHKNISSVIGMQRMKECIRKNGFKHVVVPNHYLYHLPRSGNELNDDNYIVVAEKVPGRSCDARSSITQEAANEIFRCTWEAGLINPVEKRVMITPEKKIAITNTECLERGPLWYWTLCRTFAFEASRKALAPRIVNPYLDRGILTKGMVTQAMGMLRRSLSKRHWLKLPSRKGITLFEDNTIQ